MGFASRAVKFFVLVTLQCSGAVAFHPAPPLRHDNQSQMRRNNLSHIAVLLVTSSEGGTEHLEELFGSGSDFDGVDDAPSDNDFFKALNGRKHELEIGIGKRYITRTQRGFLNVHAEPGDPYQSDNIVNKLFEGQRVTSTGSQQGDWILHDGGGWSISKYGGFTWLEPIDE